MVRHHIMKYFLFSKYFFCYFLRYMARNSKKWVWSSNFNFIFKSFFPYNKTFRSVGVVCQGGGRSNHFLMVFKIPSPTVHKISGISGFFAGKNFDFIFFCFLNSENGWIVSEIVLGSKKWCDII